MTFESILNAPAHCPECKAVVDRNDETCPNCGHSLKVSSLEQEALKYKKAAGFGEREQSNLGMMVFVLSTFLLLTATSELYDEYSAEKDYALREEAFGAFIFTLISFAAFLGLTILCYFKPMIACISGLVISVIILGLCLIGYLSDTETYTSEDIEELTIGVLILLIIPITLSIAIYRLKRKKRLTSL